MRKYSQKELLNEVFFDLIKKVGKVMSAIDPKATANLSKPFKQGYNIYKAVMPSGSKTSSNVSKSAKSSSPIGKSPGGAPQFISSSPKDGMQFIKKNPKVLKKIDSTERGLYNREIDPLSFTTINMKLPDGKAVQNLIVISKSLSNPKKQPGRYIYDKSGNFITRL